MSTTHTVNEYEYQKMTPEEQERHHKKIRKDLIANGLIVPPLVIVPEDIKQ